MLQVVKNLKPGQVSRQQIKIFPTILNPTDRVVFYVSEVTTDVAPWKVDKNAATALTIQSEFNRETGNIEFRADFPNPERLLRHGQTGEALAAE